MKKTSTVLSLFLAATPLCHSQQPVTYTSFIQLDTAITWAAECDKIINLTPKVQDFSLKKWYLEKLKKHSVTAYRINPGRRTVTSYPLSLPGLELQPWLKGLSVELSPTHNPKEWYFYDPSKPREDYNRYQYRAGRLNPASDSCCGCDEADAFMAKQILTYKKGVFSIYNVFIAPLCLRKTESPPSDWYPLCNVAYNSLPGETIPESNRDLVLLNTDYLDYEFSINSKSGLDSVLTIHRSPLISILMEDLLNGVIRAVDYESGEIIPEKELLTWKMPADTVAVYDANDPDKIMHYEAVKISRNPGKLVRFRIIQDHWFDFKNEKLYSVIRSVILMQAIYLPDGITPRGYAPLCRLEKTR